MGVYWARPTLEDIASQRAMLERGEEKRKAARQAEERERLRDTFAATALTGMIGAREWPIDSDEAAHYCYRVADAMLREREQTNHDAVPEAKAKPSDRGPDQSQVGTGNTHKPIAWARFYPNGGPESVYLDRPPADAEPLYRSPTLTDAERDAVARLRNESYCKSDENCTNADMIRLTDEEREAIKEGADALYGDGYDAEADTLRKLLERLK